MDKDDGPEGSVGFTVEDLVVAQKVYQRATQEGKS